MSKVEMSLSEALIRKANYKKQIEKLTSSINSSRSLFFCDFVIGKDEIASYSKASLDVFKENAMSTYKKASALINNYATLCKAIHKANLETYVTIGDKKMTIAEALALKENGVSSLRKALSNKLNGDFLYASNSINEINTKVNNQDNIDKYLETVLVNKDGTSAEEIERLVDVYHAQRNATIVNPLDAHGLSAKIDEEINQFDNEIDFRITEVDATTKITVNFED